MIRMSIVINNVVEETKGTHKLPAKLSTPGKSSLCLYLTPVQRTMDLFTVFILFYTKTIINSHQELIKYFTAP